MEQVRVMLVDDHPVVREGLTRVVSAWSRCASVTAYGNGAELVAGLSADQGAALAIVDLVMPEMDGFETISWLKSNRPKVLAIALTFDPSVEQVARAMACGARGALDKVATLADYHKALEDVSISGFHFNPLVARSIEHMESLRVRPEALNGIVQKLTDRELVFCDELSALDDPSYEVIAKRMGVSVNTVEVYRRNLFKKFGVRTRQGLFRALQRWRLLKR
jgi:DNA-binding NarL/FixJ family response regulator